MYKYKNIGFRPIDEADLEILRINRNNKSTLLNLGNIDLVSSEQQKSWWKNISKDKNNQWFCITNKGYQNIIGVLRFQNIDYINNCCEIGADIFPDFRGQGFGKKTYEMALEYLFCHFNMHTIYLRVAEFNKIAKNLYKKIGFKKTGSIPCSIYRHSKYWDNIIMTVLREEYQKK